MLNDFFAIDTETTGLCRWIGHRPFIVSVSRYKEGEIVENWAWEMDVDPHSRKIRTNIKTLNEIRKFTKLPTVKMFFNAKFDLLMLDTLGAVCRGPIHDVYLMARACVPANVTHSYKLKKLAEVMLGISDQDEKYLRKQVAHARMIAKRKLGWNIGEKLENDYWLPRAVYYELGDESKCDPDAAYGYAIQDTDRTALLGAVCLYGLEKSKTRHVYLRERKLIPIVIGMERRGIQVNLDMVRKRRDECAKDANDKLKRMRDLSGDSEFNPNSPQQMSKLLYGKLKIKPTIYTESKDPKPSTSSEALHFIRKDHPIADDILMYRGRVQACRLFFDKYLKLTEKSVLHPSFNQWGTITGRFSCSDPNLQQVSDPENTSSFAPEYVVDVRGVFEPRPNHNLWCFDYEQIEVVIFACMSGDEAMMSAIEDGMDVHGFVVDRIWGKNSDWVVEQIASLLLKGDRIKAKSLLRKYEYRAQEIEKELGTKILRKRAKSVTFTKIFAGGINALVKWVRCSEDEARELLDEYDNSFPTIGKAIDTTIKQAYKKGYVQNLYGRRIYIPRFFAYKASNYWVQSTAADLLKRAMIRIHADRKITQQAKVLLQLHDEIVMEAPKTTSTRIPAWVENTRRIMISAGEPIGLPINVSVSKVETNWAEKKEIDPIDPKSNRKS